MIKLNTSFSKKVPGEKDYSSKGFSASIEVELPDAMNHDQLKERIHKTFSMVKSSVESEINQKSQVENQNYSNNSHQITASKNGSKSKPTQKQIKFLNDLAKQKGVNLHSYLQDFGRQNLSEISAEECSSMIKKLKS